MADVGEGQPTAVTLGLEGVQRRGLQATGVSITISDPTSPGNPLVWVNDAFTDTTGYTYAEAVGRNCSFLQGPGTDPAAVVSIREAITAQHPITVTLVNHRADGDRFWNRLSIDPIHHDGQLVGFIGVQTDVTAEVTAQAERDAARAATEAALASERRTRRSLETAHQRLQLMAAATTRLSAFLDPDRVVEELADLCVPDLADWLFIAETDEDGTVTRVSTRHHDPTGQDAQLQQIVQVYLGRPLPATAPAAQAVAGGKTISVSGLTPDLLQPYGRGLPAEVYTALGTGSLTAVPLAAPTGTWGAMVLVRASRQSFTADDLDVATDLGRRAGQALANARTYSREATLAESLQRALLPGLPDLPDITAAAHYTSAIAGAAVGGDLYDLLDLPEGAVGIVVADVAGHDIDAAASMGTLRDLLRAQNWSHPATDPAHVLAGVDRLMDVLHLPALATAVLLHARRPTTAGGEWTVLHANAGHPPVLLRLPDGSVEPFTDHHDLMLGVDPARPRTTTTRLLPAGTQLVLHTDGLIEQPTPDGGPSRDIDTGTDRVVERLRTLPPTATPHDVVTALSDLVVGRTDDTAVLVVQLSTTPSVLTTRVS